MYKEFGIGIISFIHYCLLDTNKVLFIQKDAGGMVLRKVIHSIETKKKKACLPVHKHMCYRHGLKGPLYTMSIFFGSYV